MKEFNKRMLDFEMCFPLAELNRMFSSFKIKCTKKS